MSGIIDRGATHPVTLRFLDGELEARYQREEGAAGLVAFRLTAGASAVLWALAAVLLPIGTALPAPLMAWAGGAMSIVSFGCVAASRWAVTLDRQHGLLSMLTALNGVVILVLAATADFVEGYAVGAILLLFAFAFVSRTRFVFAAARTIVIAIGFAVVVVNYDGSGSLVIDTFIFVAGSAGTLLALRRLERDRRQVWHQQIVIAEQSAVIEKEKEESERLLLNILPASVSARLRRGESPIADNFPSVSVVFADIVGFTPLAARRTAADVITMLSELFVAFDDLVAERGLEKIKTIGDSYMAAGGLPEPLDDHAHLVVDLALAMLGTARRLDANPELTLRVGVHSGPAAGGVIGSRKFAYDVWGDTVNVASRLEQQGVPGRVHVSAATRELVDRRFTFESRGSIELRGHGFMETYLVVGRAEP